MKPSRFQQRQLADNADALAAELASDMLSFLACQYEKAGTDEEKLDIILRHSAVMHDLQRTINKTAHRSQRQPRVCPS